MLQDCSVNERCSVTQKGGILTSCSCVLWSPRSQENLVLLLGKELPSFDIWPQKSLLPLGKSQSSLVSAVMERHLKISPGSSYLQSQTEKWHSREYMQLFRFVWILGVFVRFWFQYWQLGIQTGSTVPKAVIRKGQEMVHLKVYGVSQNSHNWGVSLPLLCFFKI